jgi:hypothetical protein
MIILPDDDIIVVVVVGLSICGLIQWMMIIILEYKNIPQWINIIKVVVIYQ